MRRHNGGELRRDKTVDFIKRDENVLIRRKDSFHQVNLKSFQDSPSPRAGEKT